MKVIFTVQSWQFLLTPSVRIHAVHFV